MLKDAPILLLDEATSALDSEVEAAIQASLYRLMEGKTVVAIAHRLSTIAAMDRLVVMDQGRIVEQGDHHSLLARGGLYARLWAHQSGGFLIHFAFAAVVLPTVSMLAGELSAMRTRLKRQRSELVGALERIHKLATRDDLTGLVNRRHMTELAAMEQRRALRSGTQPCLCLVDIDHFKRINDQHGHGAGDEVLRLFSRHACAAMRETDVLARWGGEEFLVLMPDTRADEARTGIERLRRVLARDDAWGEQAHLRVSFSAGLTAWRPGEPLRDALARADDALYAAKAGGRDRLVER
jgi:diguanylate cyclase (GGDEF)-like protein